ncbi:MAG TPA: YMGG-like glycine zipper-containing protein [Blastocatellia bacterium]|nr:YMGG-like glycine zipper-containing protein [Blastocatellia bacterium]
MIRSVNNKYIAVVLLAVFLVIFSAAPESFAHRRPYRHHHSKTTGALVGGGIGAVGGALIGGGKGALIGGAAGAGTGAYIQHRRNKRHYHHRYYRQQ